MFRLYTAPPWVILYDSVEALSLNRKPGVASRK